MTKNKSTKHKIQKSLELLGLAAVWTVQVVVFFLSMFQTTQRQQQQQIFFAASLAPVRPLKLASVYLIDSRHCQTVVYISWNYLFARTDQGAAEPTGVLNRQARLAEELMSQLLINEQLDREVGSRIVDIWRRLYAQYSPSLGDTSGSRSVVFSFSAQLSVFFEILERHRNVQGPILLKIIFFLPQKELFHASRNL